MIYLVFQLNCQKVKAGWQSGYAEACKALYAGSIPASASVLVKMKIRAIILMLIFLAPPSIFSNSLSEICESPENKALAKAAGVNIDEVCSKPIPRDSEKVNLASPIKIPQRETISSSGNTINSSISPVEISSLSTNKLSSGLLPYGYDLFAGDPKTFAPTVNIPVDPDYLLGPGDSLTIQLYGKINNTYDLTIDRDGKLSFPGLGPISISGLTFKEAKELLQSRIRNQILGVESSITLGSLRSMQIFILGEAYKPGAYTISSLSTITHALIASGGVSDIGSLRNIELRRNGKLIETFDLYDLLLSGDNSKDVRLLASDVLFIPLAKTFASVDGQVLRPAIYEIKGETSVGSLIGLAGGLSPKAYPKSARVTSIDINGFLSVQDLDLTKKEDLEFRIKAGDHLEVDTIVGEKRNIVLLSGHVYFEGEFKWYKGMRISDVLPEDLIFPPKLDTNFALLVRRDPKTLEVEPIRINLKEILDDFDSPYNINLQALDSIRIFSTESKRTESIRSLIDEIKGQTKYPDLPKIVSITGPLNSAGAYPLLEGMTISDLIESAGGFRPLVINYDYALIERTDPDTGEISVSNINLKRALSKDLELNLSLGPLDHIYLFIKDENAATILQPLIGRLGPQAGSNKPAKIVSIYGTIQHAGQYPLTKNMTVTDLVIAAGGIKEETYTPNIEITRLNRSNPEEATVEKINLNLKNRGNDIILKPNDSLTLRTIPEFSSREKVNLLGEFRFPGSYQLEEGETLASLIRRTGGFTKKADVNASFFTRADLLTKEKEVINDLKARITSDLNQMELSDSSVNSELINKRRALYTAALEQLNQLQPTGRLVIPLTKILDGRTKDLTLIEGDSLIIPKKKEEVTIIGEVRKPVSVLYEPRLGLNSYLQKAGGYTDLSNKKAIYIVKANGDVIDPKRGGWLRRSKISPGDTIVVPLDISDPTLGVLPVLVQASQIIYQLSLGAAAVDSLRDD